MLRYYLALLMGYEISCIVSFTWELFRLPSLSVFDYSDCVHCSMFLRWDIGYLFRVYLDELVDRDFGMYSFCYD
jgi:hypothetical protein